MGQIAELMRHQSHKPRTHCTIEAACGACPERRTCPAYGKPERWKIMLLKEGIELAKKEFGFDNSFISKFPGNSTIGSWVKDEAIKQTGWMNGGRGGGRKATFSDNLPLEIYMITTFQKRFNFPLKKKVFKIKKLADSFLGLDSFSFNELMFNTPIVEYTAAQAKIYLNYCSKNEQSELEKLGITKSDVDYFSNLNIAEWMKWRNVWLDMYFQLKLTKELSDDKIVSFKFSYNPQGDNFFYIPKIIDRNKNQEKELDMFDIKEALNQYVTLHDAIQQCIKVKKD